MNARRHGRGRLTMRSNAARRMKVIVGADAVRTQAQFYERVWDRRHAGDDVPLKVLQGVEVREITVRSIDRVEYFRPRSTI